MVVIKSTFLLLTVAAFSAIVPVASTTSLVVEVETKKNDPEPGRPKNPLFACGMFPSSSPFFRIGVVLCAEIFNLLITRQTAVSRYLSPWLSLA